MRPVCGASKHFCTVLAAERAYRPEDAQEKSHERCILDAVQTGQPYLGATWAWAREDCTLCASGEDPASILLCDGDNCKVEAHYYCAGLDAVPRGHWFCSEKCRASVPDEPVTDQSPVLRRTHPATARAEDRLVAPSLGGHFLARASGPCEMRRVGETVWRRFAMQAQAARFYSVSASHVSRVLRSGTSLTLEGRRVVDSGGVPRTQTDAVTTTDALAGMKFLCPSCDAHKGIDAFVNPLTSKVGRDCFACVSEATVAPPPGSRVAVRFSDGKEYAGTVAKVLDENSAKVRYDDGYRETVHFPDPDVRVTRFGPEAPVRDQRRKGSTLAPRNMSSKFPLLVAPPSPAPAVALSRFRRNHQAMSKPQQDADGNYPCPAGCGRSFGHAPAAVAHAKVCAKPAAAKPHVEPASAAKKPRAAPRPESAPATSDEVEAEAAAAPSVPDEPLPRAPAPAAPVSAPVPAKLAAPRALAATSTDTAPPKAPPKKWKKKSYRGVDYEALATGMARDQWTTTEKRRTDGTGSLDRSHTRPGDPKTYRSLLEVARAHYPDLLGPAEPRRKQGRDEVPAPAPAAVPGRRPSADSASDDDDVLHAPLPCAAPPASARYTVGDAVEARWQGGPEFYPAIIVGVHAVRGWNKLDLQYSDGSGDKEWGVVEALVRPLKRRRAAATERGDDSDGDGEKCGDDECSGSDGTPVWASDVRELLVEIKAVQSRIYRRVALEDLRQQLTSRGFHSTSAVPWKIKPYIHVPAAFPCYYDVWGKDNHPRDNAMAIRAFSALVKYLERALVLARDGVAVRLESERSATLASGDADEDDDEEDADSSEDAVEWRAPPMRTGGVPPKACEIRSVGDKLWRRFASRNEAAEALPELSRQDIGKLISNKPADLAVAHIRERFEARNAVEADEEEEEAGDDWATAARKLLRKVKLERYRNRYPSLEGFQAKLGSYGFKNLGSSWKTGY